MGCCVTKIYLPTPVLDERQFRENTHDYERQRHNFSNCSVNYADGSVIINTTDDMMNIGGK